jgi:hypothetical protein
MENYVPPKTNPMKKVAKNIGVQIFLVVLILLIASSIIISRSESIRSTIGIDSSVSIISKSANSRFDTAQELPRDEALETKSADTESLPPDSAQTPASQDLAATPNPDTESGGSAESNKSISVNIGILEVPQDELQQVYDTSRKNQLFMQFTDFSAGMAQFKLKQWSENKKAKVLFTETRTMEINSPIELRFLTPQETQIPVGIMISLNVREHRNNTFFGDLEVIRLWKTGSESAPQEDRVSFPADVEITSEMSFFVGGIIPRQNLKIVEDALKSIEIFKGISSPAFKNGQNDIIIAFEFDHTAPQK